jgi:serine/threonine-protein kinase RIO1
MIKTLNKNNICHGDASWYNIVYQESNDKLYFIDIESLKI